MLYDTTEIIQFICNELQQVSIPWLFLWCIVCSLYVCFSFLFPVNVFLTSRVIVIWILFVTDFTLPTKFTHLFMFFVLFDSFVFFYFFLIRVLWTNNNNDQDNVYGAVIMAEPLREFTALFDECRTALSGRRPKTKPDDLACESACTGCQNLHPPSPFIITQPKTWYFTVPRRVEGWVDLAGWLHTEMVYTSTDGHPSWY